MPAKHPGFLFLAQAALFVSALISIYTFLSDIQVMSLYLYKYSMGYYHESIVDNSCHCCSSSSTIHAVRQPTRFST